MHYTCKQDKSLTHNLIKYVQILSKFLIKSWVNLCLYCIHFFFTVWKYSPCVNDESKSFKSM